MTQHNGPQDPTQWSGQPPQSGGPYPPVPPGPEPTKRNWFARHKILTGLCAVVAVVVIATIATSASQSSSQADDTSGGTSAAAAAAPADTGSTAPAQQDSPAEPAKKATGAADDAPHIGTPVTSGDLQFTVTKVVRGKAEVGQQYLTEKAQGSYTLVYVTVRNVGDDSETLIDSDQKIKDADNKTYSPDSTAELSMKNNNVFLEQINPGNAVDGVLVYDMPVGVKATAIDFSGGLLEDATTVQLH